MSRLKIIHVDTSADLGMWRLALRDASSCKDTSCTVYGECRLQGTDSASAGLISACCGHLALLNVAIRCQN